MVKMQFEAENDNTPVKNKYSHCVLIDNWKLYRDIEQVQAISTQKALYDKSHDVHITREVIANITKQVVLPNTEGYVFYDLPVQLFAPEVTMNNPPLRRTEKGLFLAVSGSANKLWTQKRFGNDCILTAAPSTIPMLRNSFILVCLSRGSSETDSHVRYGDGFAIRTLEPHDKGFYVETTRPLFGAVSGRSKHSAVVLTDIFNSYVKWEVKPAKTSSKQNLVGVAVKEEDEVILQHSATNRLLRVESRHVCNTVLGWEAEVSAHSEYDLHKLDDTETVWKFNTGQRRNLKEVEQKQEEQGELVALSFTVIKKRLDK